MLLVAAALLLAGGAARAEESSHSENPARELVKDLRRQLMRDNSDYSSEKSSTTERIHMRVDPHFDNPHEENINNYYVTNKNNFNTMDREYKNVAHNTKEIKKQTKAEYPISEKDLLYYIDDEKLRKKHPEGRKDSDIKNNSLPSVEYKMLKVRHQFRRSGQNRYIQEEGKEGVAIMSLDKGPFPELRLPQSRRQYKHDHGEAMTDDEEIPPPPVNTSDPEAAVDDVELGITQFTSTS